MATESLKRHKLGWADVEVTEVCLGTMTWGRQNTEQDAHEQLDYAIKERGVNFIDTAEVYPVPMQKSKNYPQEPKDVVGLTEEYIGTWFAKNPEWREKVVLATKVAGYLKESDGAYAGRFKEHGYRAKNAPEDCKGPMRHNATNFLAAVEASCARLQTSYIDLYQLHWPDRYTPRFGATVYKYANHRTDDVIPFAEIVAGIKALLDSGKVRYWGVSNETTFGLCQLVAECDRSGVPRPVTIQNEYHLLNRAFDYELAEACAPCNFNIGLLPWSPLAGGALTGKYLDIDCADWPERTRFGEFRGYQERFSKNLKTEPAIRKYKEIADKLGVSLTTLSLAWCKSREYCNTGATIIGATTMEQLKGNIDAFSVELSEEVLQDMDVVFEHHRDCSRAV
jgi:aryl-alcohol dehydrogenase-like predicted oxidoreductase